MPVDLKAIDLGNDLYIIGQVMVHGQFLIFWVKTELKLIEYPQSPFLTLATL